MAKYDEKFMKKKKLILLFKLMVKKEDLYLKIRFEEEKSY